MSAWLNSFQADLQPDVCQTVNGLPVYYGVLTHHGYIVRPADDKRLTYTFLTVFDAEQWLRKNGGGIIIKATDTQGNAVEQTVCEPAHAGRAA